MTTKRPGKKILKITGWILGVPIILFIGLHLWINYNARQIVEDLVDSKSKGRLKLKIEKFRFSWFSKKVELHNAVIYTTDSANAGTSYRFSVNNIKLTAQEVLPIIFSKKLLIDSLNLDHPEIIVTRQKAVAGKDRKSKKEVSIPEELGKIYNSIQDALQALKVNRFQIDDAKFTLINKILPNQVPLTITNIHFHIDNLSVDKNKKEEEKKLLFSENVVLNSKNQAIIFPDSRHKLSFSNFKINLLQKLVEFDSCTIAAEQKDSAKTSFRVFFDTLRLTSIDFDTLYKHEVIKADSVYCLNPKFDLEVEVNRKKEGNKKNPPKLEDIIQQLTGDLRLGFVVVNNAGFNIKTKIDDKPTSFAFSNNNFELQGLSVEQNSTNPIHVKSFALAIRNYENFIRDSAYNARFDSILFKEDRIYLGHFVFDKLDKGKVISSFSIPRFELKGLSWDELVFRRQLKAGSATLYHPAINYTVEAKREREKGKKSIFSTLGDIGQLVQLEKMNIVNGQIDINLNNNSFVQLKDASMTVKTQTLLNAKKARALEHAVEYLDFKSGNIKTGSLNIKLEDVMYTGNKNGFLLAKRVQVTDQVKHIAILAENTAVDDILADEETGDISITGTRWNKADVKILLPEKNNDLKSSLELQDVKGANTFVNISSGNKTISTFLKEISIDELLKVPGKKIQLKNLSASGQKLKIAAPAFSLSISDYSITDRKESTLLDTRYNNVNNNNRINISVPSVTMIPDINVLLNGKIKFAAIFLDNPVAMAVVYKKDITKKEIELPEIDIDNLNVSQPVISFRQQSEKGNLDINWRGNQEKDNKIRIKGLTAGGGNKAVLSAEELGLHLGHFAFSTPKGKTYAAGNGKITTEIKDIKLHRENGSINEWNVTVSNFQAANFKLDSLGKKNGLLSINKAGLKSFNLSSASVKDFYQLASANLFFQLQEFTGSYRDEKKEFNWQNANFNPHNKTLSLDSFSYNPTPSRDSFIAKLTYQKDYIKTGAGSINIKAIDIAKFTKDSVLNIGKIIIDKPYFTDYKDKNLSFAAGTIKPLPVSMIKEISFPLSVDTVQINNASVEYTEVSNKTKLPGTVPVTRMAITLLKVKNYALGTSDSLTIRAVGYVMDTVWIRLRVKESYTDSLGGFLMTLQLKPGDLTVLNTALIPLASVKLISGKLDTLSMRAVGREYLSLGKMKMFYEDLKIQLLKNGNDEKRPFLARLITFAANSFLIRKNNKSRTGNVFFIRQRDRSAINYLIRIALSGMASSAGLKSNKKMYRRYQKEIEKRNLPPIEFE